MVGIIVTGHGHFPSGLLSAVKLVAGKPEGVIGVDFEDGQSSEDLQRALEAAVGGLEGDEILILADLVGGSPFNTACMLGEQFPGKKIRVLAGVNMAGMVEAVFSRVAAPLDQLAGMVKEAALAGVTGFEDIVDEEETEFSDGL